MAEEIKKRFSDSSTNINDFFERLPDAEDPKWAPSIAMRFYNELADLWTVHNSIIKDLKTMKLSNPESIITPDDISYVECAYQSALELIQPIKNLDEQHSVNDEAQVEGVTRVLNNMGIHPHSFSQMQQDLQRLVAAIQPPALTSAIAPQPHSSNAITSPYHHTNRTPPLHPYINNEAQQGDTYSSQHHMPNFYPTPLLSSRFNHTAPSHSSIPPATSITHPTSTFTPMAQNHLPYPPLSSNGNAQRAYSSMPFHPTYPQPNQVHSTASHIPSANIQFAQLPRLDLPKFSGSYTEWESFHDLFETMVHLNPSIPNVLKLHHLRSSLIGEAAGIIKHMNITGNNYESAWNLLIQRYQNERVIIGTHIARIVNMPLMKIESSSDIKNMLDNTAETINCLANLGQPTNSWGVWFIYHLVQKLDHESRKLWEQSLGSSTAMPSYADLQRFLECRFRTLEAIGNTTCTNANASKADKLRSFHSGLKAKCSCCESNTHHILECFVFKSKSLDTRREFVLKKNLCFRCLLPNCRYRKCRSHKGCSLCNSRHNTILHKEFANKTNNHENTDSVQAHHNAVNSRNANNNDAITPESINNTSSNAPVIKVSSNFGKQISQKRVLLATALVRLQLLNKSVTLRALLDQGSESSFVTSAVIRQFKIPLKQTKVSISGLNSVHAGVANGLVSLQLGSNTSVPFEFEVNALVLDNITGHMPSACMGTSAWQHTAGLELADPSFDQPKSIDLLLGADIYGILMKEGIQHGPPGTPTAQQTHLGWILSGCFDEGIVKNVRSNVSNLNDSIDKQLAKFWELEELLPKVSQDEINCEQFFNKTFGRSDTGQFIVRLPFKNSKKFGNSRKMAEIRFLQMEKKFSRNTDFHKQYSMFLKEYLDLGHMQIAPLAPKGEVYYLPHHAVTKVESSSTKLRVVFDGSCKGSAGISLNDRLHVGPSLQDDLVSILTRWRTHAIAYVTDITKMYRMIRIHPNDFDYQRILWRMHPNEPLQEYQLTTVTYGTASAAFLAVRALRKLAELEAHAFPAASKITLTDFYVDDCISGASDLKTALDQQKQLIKMLELGGFRLRKWASNHPEVLKAIPVEDRECSLPLHIEVSDTVKTLGIRWTPSTDSFSFKITMPSNSLSTTKRKLLSDVARLFDPMGWLAPIVVECKILYQNLWTTGLKWDDKLTPALEERWQTIKTGLVDIEHIVIPRWFGTNGQKENIELHGFADASMVAYGAVVYIRIKNENGSYKLSVIAAKSKVAPVKTVSLPRLELCAAVLLTRLFLKVKVSMHYNEVPTFAWTDSQIVLYWLRKNPRECHVFVANRIAEIQESIRASNWWHIPSALNPADCISRGMVAKVLIQHDLWWNGPQFLRAHNEWPTQILQHNPDVDLELKKVNSFAINITNLWNIIDRFSELRRLVRVTSYCARFINNVFAQSIEQRVIGPLTPAELKAALQHWIKMSQIISFHDDYRRLVDESELAGKSKLLSMRPFIDENGLMRIGGRLKNALISFDEKHPIILPKAHLLTNLIIADAHQKTLHGGPQQTLAYLHRKYWIVDGRNQVRKYCHSCINCFRNAPRASSQLMGDLPHARVNQHRPFLHSGIDFAGPFSIRISKGRGTRCYKGYIAVIVCFSTKAIHLEVVSDLTSAALLAALRRFVSRRGLCSDIYSDNATNFVGAAKTLSRDFQTSVSKSSREVAAILANDSINWHFIPPRSPHFGGLWEAGVRSTKHHFRRVVGANTLTYEELTTVLNQIEASLNSRPLTPLSSNPEDLQALTPGHFIIGSAINAIPDPSLLEHDTSTLTRWQHLQHMHQSFWKRWSSEYINNLQQRTKWTTAHPNIETGQLAIIREDNLPPSKWLLGRIIQTHPGSDGRVRVVTIRTKDGNMQRPIVKLCLLPIANNTVFSQGAASTY